MKYRTGELGDVVRADYTRRIVVTPDGLEFLDQAVTFFRDTAADEEVEVEHAGSTFLTAHMEDAWAVEIEIPVTPGPQERLVDGTLVLGDVPDTIPWEAPEPTAPPDHGGPKLRLTVGQAIQALAVYADMLRAQTPSNP
jgi:hypothetical protein